MYHLQARDTPRADVAEGLGGEGEFARSLLLGPCASGCKRVALSGVWGSWARRCWLVAAALGGVVLSGCSIHPIPDDVSPIPTEEIVRSARCELRLGLLDQVEKKLRSRGITEWGIKNLQTKNDWTKFAAFLKARIAKNPADAVLNADLIKYGQVAVAYDFDFNITEHDSADAGLAFKLPKPHSTFDLTAGGSLKKTRAGQRTFKAQETFAELITRDVWCAGFQPREKNILYPITGSIGLRKVVETFVEISEQGGGKDSFVDVMTFTTTVSGNVGATVKIDPVPKSFRLVSATANLAADRIDIHKITVSLAFPQPVKLDATGMKTKKPTPPSGLDALTDGYELNTAWRARYNICVADARNREETFNALRLTAPEVYCITHADAFVPRYANPAQVQLLPRWPR
jgi:hypothetical protein